MMDGDQWSEPTWLRVKASFSLFQELQTGLLFEHAPNSNITKSIENSAGLLDELATLLFLDVSLCSTNPFSVPESRARLLKPLKR
jgi:hypothetical protein